MGAPAASCPAPVEIHHAVPQCLLTLREKADACGLDGEGIEAWLEYEHEAMRWGVNPDVTRDDLAILIDASTVALGRGEHRSEHAGDFVRWGRRGGLRRSGATGGRSSGCSGTGATGASRAPSSRRPRPSSRYRGGRRDYQAGRGAEGPTSLRTWPGVVGARALPPTSAPGFAEGNAIVIRAPQSPVT